MRCPVCFEPISDAPRPCADCGTKYHSACWSEGGCLVAGCTPRQRVAAPIVAESSLWKPAVIACSLGVAIGVASVHPDSGLPPLLARMGVSLAISCWCAGGGGMLIAGFQDLGWNIPAGATVRPDRLGTMSAMAVGLAMVLVGVGGAMRVVDVSNYWISMLFCAGSAGLLLVGLATSLLGMTFDRERQRAQIVVLPLLIAMGVTFAEARLASTKANATSVYPKLPRPR